MALLNLKIALLAIFAKFVVCRPDGASVSSCATLKPNHFNPVLEELSEGQDQLSPYKFTARWDKDMKMIRVSVSGDRIQGFLLQGRRSKGGPAVGSFFNITENPDATYQDCSFYDKFAPNSSVTHRNSRYQDKLEFYWEPPSNASIADKITFFATFAKNKNVFWVFEKSNTLSLNMDDPSNEDHTTNIPTKTILLSTENNGSIRASVVVLLQTLSLLMITILLS